MTYLTEVSVSARNYAVNTDTFYFKHFIYGRYRTEWKEI